MTKFSEMTIEEFAKATDLMAHLAASVDGFQKSGIKTLEGLQRGSVTLTLIFEAESGRFRWAAQPPKPTLVPLTVTDDGDWTSKLPEIKIVEAKPIGEIEINNQIAPKTRRKINIESP